VSIFLLACGAIGLSLFAGLWTLLHASLPPLDGARKAAGLQSPVTISRDALGVASITGASRLDVAYATGFAHAQDRFFQMDLLRRVAAGELSEIVGPAALDIDRRHRPHAFRDRAHRLLAALPPDDRALIERYSEGVNDGLASLHTRPFEYWVLRSRPVAWRPEDTVLAVYAMYFDLQEHEARHILARAALRETVSAKLLPFLLPSQTHWDAPLDAASSPAPTPVSVPVASPPWLTTRYAANRQAPGAATDTATPNAPLLAFLDDSPADGSMVGSNGWVVAGERTANGGALLASDMHLSLSLPNIWYRVSLQWHGPDGAAHRITGISLPGVPAVIAGSNGKVAWGFTNSYGRFTDLIALQRDPADPLRYRVPGGGWARSSVRHETIRVKGAPSVDLPIVETQWGPQFVVGKEAYAMRWVAHDPQAVNMNLMRLEQSGSVADAMHVAQTSGLPTQNFMVADAQGHIGWTLAGPLRKREPAAREATLAAFDNMPDDSSSYRSWHDYLPPQAYPARLDPPLGMLWTANNRTLPPAQQALVGDSGSDLGARATQIRDDLLALPHANERAMLAVQTDDRAKWIAPWRAIALDALDADALARHPERAAFAHALETWDGRASADAVGYRLVRAFFFSLYDAWFGKLDETLTKAMPPGMPRFVYRLANSRYEVVMEELATQHAWVPAGYADWRAFVLDRIDVAIARLPSDVSVDTARWGDFNRAAIAHPFARLVPAWLPAVRAALSAPGDPLPGDVNMPRVQTPGFGASERMVVSPGHEQEGFFEMPGGQSGHPLSPYFLAGHEDWVHGRAMPFEPGPAVHTMRLVPAQAK
jgi:penicillin amidase